MIGPFLWVLYSVHNSVRSWASLRAGSSFSQALLYFHSFSSFRQEQLWVKALTVFFSCYFFNRFNCFLFKGFYPFTCISLRELFIFFLKASIIFMRWDFRSLSCFSGVLGYLRLAIVGNWVLMVPNCIRFLHLHLAIWLSLVLTGLSVSDWSLPPWRQAVLSLFRAGLLCLLLEQAFCVSSYCKPHGRQTGYM